MTIFLHILGIIGKILLILLCVILALLLLLLLVPFRYRAEISRHQKRTEVHATVCWLFRAFWFRFDFLHENGNTRDMDLRIFGIPVLQMLEKRKNKDTSSGEKRNRRHTAAAAARTDKAPAGHASEKDASAAARSEEAERRMREGAKKKPTVQPGQRAEKVETGPEVHVFRRKQPSLLERASARFVAFVSKIRDKVRKFFSNLAVACGKIRAWAAYLHTDSFRGALEVLRKQGIPLLRHILPGKIEGQVEFGLEDPASTGELLGAAAVFYPILPADLRVVPNFEQQMLEADVTVRGRIVLLVVVIRGLRIFLNKNFRALVRVIRKKDPAAAKQPERREKTA